MQDRSLEVNTAEKILLSADGTKTFCSCRSSPEKKVTTSEPLMLPQYKNSNFQNKSEVKMKMGIIKTVTAHWKNPEKSNKKPRVVRSSSIGDRLSSTSSQQPPRRSLDPQTAPLYHGGVKMPIWPDFLGKEAKLRPVKPNHCRRVVVLGAPRVGKTAILRRFLTDRFEHEYEPTTEDFHSKLYHIRGETYQIDFLDAAKERDFPAKRRLSILTGDIFLLVFSVDDRSSFLEVCALRDEIVAAKSKLIKSKENHSIPIIVCGNKIDLALARSVTPSEVFQLLGHGCALFHVSAKDSTNLGELFGALAELGELPTETRPSLHRDISIRSYQALSISSTISRRRRSKREARARVYDEPCGVVHPLARRPSFGSDLRRVMGPSTAKRSRPIEKCQIQ